MSHREIVPPNPGEFRQGMSRVAGAVHIITTEGHAGRAGLTVTAVTAVSDDPGTMLVCIHRTSSSLARIKANGVFCINTLSGDQDALADVFAGRTHAKREERFKAGDWTLSKQGSWILASACVAFECCITSVHDIATHDVLVGAVVGLHTVQNMKSLVYVDRLYHKL